MLGIKKRWLALVAVQLVALAIGALGAFAHASHSSTKAHAAAHCTRYAPTPVSVDVNCYTKGGIDANYTTPSYGWRDAQGITLDANRSWELYYFTTSGASVVYRSGYGLGGNAPGYLAAQTKADCNVNTGTVNGNCSVNWHD
jgi:hypothetical protein